MLVLRIKPCMPKFNSLYETVDGSIKDYSFKFELTIKTTGYPWKYFG